MFLLFLSAHACLALNTVVRLKNGALPGVNPSAMALEEAWKTEWLLTYFVIRILIHFDACCASSMRAFQEVQV